MWVWRKGEFSIQSLRSAQQKYRSRGVEQALFHLFDRLPTLHAFIHTDDSGEVVRLGRFWRRPDQPSRHACSKRKKKNAWEIQKRFFFLLMQFFMSQSYRNRDILMWHKYLFLKCTKCQLIQWLYREWAYVIWLDMEKSNPMILLLFLC